MINVYSAQQEIKQAKQELKDAKKEAFKALPKRKQARIIDHKLQAVVHATGFAIACRVLMQTGFPDEEAAGIGPFLLKMYETPLMDYLPLGLLVHAIAAYAFWKLETKDKTDEVLEAEANLAAVKAAHSF